MPDWYAKAEPICEYLRENTRVTEKRDSESLGENFDSERGHEILHF